MGLFEQFPYTNFHDLNLGWVLDIIKKNNEYLKHISNTINEEIAKQLVLLNICNIIDKLQAEYIADTESIRLGIDPKTVCGHYVISETMYVDKKECV